MSLEQLKHRSVIKFLTKEGKNPKIIRERMISVYADGPTYFTIKFWVREESRPPEKPRFQYIVEKLGIDYFLGRRNLKKNLRGCCFTTAEHLK